MFKTVNSDATKLVSKIGILNRSFKDIQLDFKTLSSSGGIKNIFNIVTSKDINNLESYCKAISNGTPRLAAFNQYIQNAPTAIRKQALEFTRQKNNLDNLTRSFQQGKITQEEYNSQSAILKNQMASLQTQSLKLTIQQKALAIASRLASTAISMIANIAVGIAINGIITLISKLVNAEKELIQKNKELADSYKNNVQALEDYREKYLDIIDSTDSEAEKDKQLIEWKKQLVKQYGLEEEALANVNKERQTGIDLINQELYKEATKTIDELKGYEEAYKKIYNASNVINNQRGFNAMRGFEQYGIGFDAVSNRDGSFNIKITYNTNDANKQLEQLGKLLSDLKAKSLQLDKNNPLYNQFHSSVNNQIEFVQKEYDRVKGIVDNYSDTVSTGLAAYAQKYLYEFTQQTDGALANVIDQASFNAWKDKLLEMAGDSEPVKEALEKLANEMFPNYSSSVDNSTTSTNNAITSVTSLTDTFTALKEVLEDIIKSSDKYKDAMSNIASGSALTAEEVASLLEIDPTLFDKFTKVDNGWTISPKDLRDSYNQNIKDAVASKVGGTKEEFETALEQGNSRLLELQKQRNEILSLPIPESAKQEQLKSIDEQLQSIQDTVQDAKENIGLIDFYSELFSFKDSDVASEALEKIKDAFSDTKQEIENYNNSISNINGAIDTLNEGNSLSYDEMTELVNLYPQLQDKVVKTTNGYTIEISALEGVRTQSYQTRNDYIDNQIEMLRTTLETTRERIRLYYAEIGALNNYYEAKKAFEDTEADRQTIASIAELIEILEGYKSEVLDTSNSGSSGDTLSNELQNQIDYYNMLLEAIEIVSDKYIQSLEDEKDALKEKNDEQQRELDLLEAKNNLEKAKKQKVFVYKEGQGLVQVQDEKAIRDAQKEYDDIQNEIKIDEIDKQIDKREEYKKQFSEMENNIQDTLTVEQAKKALGTGEQGLLSLDNKTIAGIRDGLAEAIYKKDVEDNKDNPKYQVVSFDDFLKSVGATVTSREFQSMASSINANVPVVKPNTNNTINNAQTINNSTSNIVNAVFNISGTQDSQGIATEVEKCLHNLFTKALISVK